MEKLALKIHFPPPPVHHSLGSSFYAKTCNICTKHSHGQQNTCVFWIFMTSSSTCVLSMPMFACAIITTVQFFVVLKHSLRYGMNSQTHEAVMHGQTIVLSLCSQHQSAIHIIACLECMQHSCECDILLIFLRSVWVH